MYFWITLYIFIVKSRLATAGTDTFLLYLLRNNWSTIYCYLISSYIVLDRWLISRLNHLIDNNKQFISNISYDCFNFLEDMHIFTLLELIVAIITYYCYVFFHIHFCFPFLEMTFVNFSTFGFTETFELTVWHGQRIFITQARHHQ